MKSFYFTLLILGLPLMLNSQTIHHNLKVKVSVADHYIEVVDEITFRKNF